MRQHAQPGRHAAVRRTWWEEEVAAAGHLRVAVRRVPEGVSTSIRVEREITLISKVALEWGKHLSAVRGWPHDLDRRACWSGLSAG